MSKTPVDNAPTATQRRMSPNQLRDRLRDGLEQLLALLPEGDELTLDCQHRDQSGFCIEGSFVPDDPAHNLKLLRDFSNIVEALCTDSGGTGHPPEKIREIMDDLGNGTQLTLIEATDAFVQRFLD